MAKSRLRLARQAGIRLTASPLQQLLDPPSRLQGRLVLQGTPQRHLRVGGQFSQLLRRLLTLVEPAILQRGNQAVDALPEVQLDWLHLLSEEGDRLLRAIAQ